MNERITGYYVLAGKWDDGGENIKVAHWYPTLDEALKVYDECQGYHFRRIELALDEEQGSSDV